MLTDDEAVAMEILSHEDMLAIGRWKDVIKGLASRGLCVPVLDQWHRITPAGIVAFEAYERAQYAPVIEGESVDV